MNEVGFTIIMAAYNASKYIRPAIESVLNQTYENWQLIIVDDGSTDDTLQIAQEYAASESRNRIVVIHQNNSGTAAAARNTALEYVTGDYVQTLDSDDYLSEDCLQKYASIIKREKDYPTIVLPIALSVQDDGQVIREISQTSAYVGCKITSEEAFVLSLDWSLHGIMCVCSDLIKKIKYDPILVNGDELTTRKLFANAKTVMVIDGIYYYRDNQESTTKSTGNKCRMTEALITDANIYDYAVEHGMSENVINKCAKKWMKAIIAHEAQYLRAQNEYTIAERDYASGIIERSFMRASREHIYEKDSSIWGKIVGWCKENTSRLEYISGWYNLLWKIKEIIVKK